MTCILVVDDEEHIREVVCYALTRAGLAVEQADDGRAALTRIERGGIDLVVLDILMPELDGLSVCRELRARGDLPIIFLSSRADEVDRVLGLELGGDDYLVKPFSPRELVARVRTVLRRLERPTTRTDIVHGPLRLDPAAVEAHVDGARVELTVTEFRVLHQLLAHPGRVHTRAQLIASAHDDARYVSERTIDTHIRRVRAKLRARGVEAIETVHGLGYKAAPVPVPEH